MSIELHCPSCTKLIRAPHDAGGKSGKCPYCQRKVYIPMPKDEIEPIPLAPVDPSEAQREDDMRRESAKYAAAIDHGGDAGQPPPGGEAPDEAIDIPEQVKRFVSCMHTSDLEQAEQIAAGLRRAGERSRDYIQSIQLDEMPLKVDDLPAPLVQGFLKALLQRLE